MLITGLYQPILWLADRFFIRINKDFIIIIIIKHQVRKRVKIFQPSSKTDVEIFIYLSKNGTGFGELAVYPIKKSKD